MFVFAYVCFLVSLLFSAHVFLFLFLVSVVCDPPCDNGVCVANDTCQCPSGYSGPSCSQPGIPLHSCKLLLVRLDLYTCVHMLKTIPVDQILYYIRTA